MLQHNYRFLASWFGDPLSPKSAPLPITWKSVSRRLTLPPLTLLALLRPATIDPYLIFRYESPRHRFSAPPITASHPESYHFLIHPVTCKLFPPSTSSRSQISRHWWPNIPRPSPNSSFPIAAGKVWHQTIYSGHLIDTVYTDTTQ